MIRSAALDACRNRPGPVSGTPFGILYERDVARLDTAAGGGVCVCGSIRIRIDEMLAASCFGQWFRFDFPCGKAGRLRLLGEPQRSFVVPRETRSLI